MSSIRSTLFTRLNLLASETSRISAKMSEASEMAVTGLKYSKPSDEPSKVGTVHAIREELMDQDVWTDNAELAQSILALADGALSNMTDLMASIKELAVQMSSEHYESGGMSEAAEEATAYLESMVHHANIDMAGRYIFAGASYDTEAFDSTGTYLGDNIEPEIPVGDGLTVAGGFDGSDALQGTTDVFQVINDFITALGTNDADAVSGLLDEIDDAQSQLIAAQAEIGAEMLKNDDALELAASLKNELTIRHSGLTEVDQVESYATLMQYQTAYEAALQVTASSQVGNLFGKI